MVTIGIIAFEILLYLVFIKMFAVLPVAEASSPRTADRRLP